MPSASPAGLAFAPPRPSFAPWSRMRRLTAPSSRPRWTWCSLRSNRDLPRWPCAAPSGAARQTAGELGRSLQPIVIGWRRFAEWPDDLLSAMRTQISGELEKSGAAAWKGLAAAERKTLLDELVQLTQAQMHARYQQRLV